MSSVTQLKTTAVLDAKSTETVVDRLVELFKEGRIRSLIVHVNTTDGNTLTNQANTTLSDEAYAIAVWQARLHRLISEP